MPDPKAVNSMFARIAGRYDLANRLLSGGIDQYWRQCLLRSVRGCAPTSVLDLATGSGDVAFVLADGLKPGTRISGMDFCVPMLDQAKQKQAHRTQRNWIEFSEGDGLAIPAADASFDAITVSFGLRNMADRPRALREMARVLRPNGHLFVLEFSQPYWWFRPVYYAYLHGVLPLIAGAVTGDRSAYEYLGGSIADFPSTGLLAGEISRAGFREVHAQRLTFGIVALHHGMK